VQNAPIKRGGVCVTRRLQIRRLANRIQYLRA
jgi:hypothetical protein